MGQSADRNGRSAGVTIGPVSSYRNLADAISCAFALCPNRGFLMLDDGLRAKQKRLSRARDEMRLKSGEISRDQLKHDNSFFNALPIKRFKMVSVGDKPLKT